MKWLLLVSALILAACDFQPIYGTHSESGQTIDMMNQVAIDSISDRNGQMLRNDLIDRMYSKGRPKKPLYHLRVSINASLQDLGIQANATSTRSLLDMTVNYNLMDTHEKTVLSGTAHSITSFNKLSDQYGSLISDESAYERTLKEASEQIVNRLSLYFSEPLQPKPDEMIIPQAPLPMLNSNGLPTTSNNLPHN